uniref:Uncharacterized protein n=1 Tax=Macrostomum lignano TaxID=282301 RepID=A0A1I8F5P0_9PLAT
MRILSDTKNIGKSTSSALRYAAKWTKPRAGSRAVAPYRTDSRVNRSPNTVSSHTSARCTTSSTMKSPDARRPALILTPGSDPLSASRLEVSLRRPTGSLLLQRLQMSSQMMKTLAVLSLSTLFTNPKDPACRTSTSSGTTHAQVLQRGPRLS